MSPAGAVPVEEPVADVGGMKTAIHKCLFTLHHNSVLTGRSCGLGSAIGWFGVPEKAYTEGTWAGRCAGGR